MAWTVRITKTAEKQLKKLSKVVQERIVEFLQNNINGSNNPRSVGKALRGEKQGLWRYRIGDYRLICHIEDKTVTVVVLELGHRKDIYR